MAMALIRLSGKHLMCRKDLPRAPPPPSTPAWVNSVVSPAWTGLADFGLDWTAS